MVRADERIGWPAPSGVRAHRFVTTALRERLAQIEPQEAAAAVTDWSGPQ